VAIVLGANQYGKAEIRLLRVSRGTPAADQHDITDLNVSVTLAGDMAAAHLTGDNAAVLTTDAQKNTVFAFAGEHGVGQIEDFGLRLARHFVDTHPTVSRARVSITQYPWDRIGATGHSFARSGGEVRTATVTYDGTGTYEGTGAWAVSGLEDLTVLNSAGSEFWGFVKDRYTTLPETTDRILATAVSARWRHASADAGNWSESYAEARRLLLEAFADTYSYSLQQTLYEMGRRVLAARPEIAEMRLALPNKHHYAVDLSGFGVDSDNEVFYASDRPYGLIEGTVTRDDAPPPGLAW
jgi:urate oxidase